MQSFRSWISPSVSSWDLTGIGLSALCLAHCLAAPLMIGAFPVVSFLAADDSLHLVLAFALLLIAGWAFYRGFKVHGKGKIPLLGGLGVLLLFLSLIVPGASHHVHSAHGTGLLALDLNAELGLSVLGSSILIWAHLSNRKHCRHSCCCPATAG